VDITGSTTITGNTGSAQSGYMNVAGTVTVAIKSGGSLTINGTTNTTPGGIVGQNAAGTSTLSVENGGSLTYSGNQGVAFGNNISTAIGVLEVSGNATINAGSTTATDQRSFITLGRDSATGTVNLNAGGVLATSRNFIRDGSGDVDVTGAANFNFKGGTLKALANQTDWLNSSTKNTNQLALSSVTTTATSTIDANGFSVAINSAISGAGGFNITNSTGTGTVTFGGVNTYIGSTTVKSGTLALANSSANNIASSSKILVGDTAAHNTAGLTVSGLNSGGGLALAANQTLAGYGTVTGNVTGVSTSTFAPGDTNANGQLSVKGNFTLGAGSLAVDLNPAVHAAGATLTAGTDYDQLVDATGSTVNVSNGVLALTIGNNLVNNDVFTILDNQGISAVIGNFASATVNGTAATGSLANGGTFSANVGGTNYSFLINYGAETGNDVTLTVAVPEPGTCAAMIGLGGIGLLTRRRRKA
jgi:autotransporter-associated beta strand protein